MRTGDLFSHSSERACSSRCVSKITFARGPTLLLVILQRVYILGPRTNLTWRLSHGESKEEGQKESFEKEVRPSATAGLGNTSLAVLQSFKQCPRKRALPFL